MSDDNDIPTAQAEPTIAGTMTDTAGGSSPLRQYRRHPLETRHALPMALLRARETVMSRFRPMLNAHEISEQQWRVMRVLSEGGVLEATEISQRSCIFASSLSRIIKTLERQNILTRERSAQDGRRVRLRLTDKGNQIVGEITPESLAIYADLESRYGPDRVKLLIDMLNDLEDLGAARDAEETNDA